MTYEDIIEQIQNTSRFGKACGKDVTFEMMKYLGNPESSMKVIHIAGTNGKGSVAAFLTSMIMNVPGLKVGTFTSPHLIDFRERIMVNGEMIPKQKVKKYGQYLLNAPMHLSPTMFDYCLGIAILYFAECKCDFVILETGLGGTKDSTRGLMVTPAVSVITNIGLEHTEILGSDIETIASEKAGILRSGTVAVLGKMAPEALSVITDRCDSLGVPYSVADELLDDSVELGLFGNYQRQNATTAAYAAKRLQQIFPSIFKSQNFIEKGLRDARWPGRMEIVSKKPFIMLDGAHNPHGVKALCDSLKAAFPEEKFTFICCVMKDKDYETMIDLTGEIAARYIAMDIAYGRTLAKEKLAETIGSKGYVVSTAESVMTAVEQAKENEEKIIICGSLYFIGDAKKELVVE